MSHPVETRVPRGRLDALSDGVYAIAVTLLVLELRLPALADHLTESTLVQALSGLVPKVLVWLLSFCVTVLQWTSSARLSRLSGEDGVATLRLELTQLALVRLLPFTTAVMGEHGNLSAAAALYSGHLCLLALLTAARVAIVLPRDALAPHDTMREARHQLLTRSTWAAGCAAAAFALAFVLPGWNMLALLPIAIQARLSRLVRSRRA